MPDRWGGGADWLAWPNSSSRTWHEFGTVMRDFFFVRSLTALKRDGGRVICDDALDLSMVCHVFRVSVVGAELPLGETLC